MTPGPSMLRRRPSFQSVLDAEGSGSGVSSAGLEETRVAARTLEHVERKSRRWIGRSDGEQGEWVVAWEVKMDLDYVKSAAGKTQNLTLTLNMAKERQTHWVTPGLIPSSRLSTQRSLHFGEGEEGEIVGGDGIMVTATPATPQRPTANPGILMGRRSPSPTPSNASTESAPATGVTDTSLRPELPSSSADAGGRKVSLLSVLTSRSTDSLVSDGLSAIQAIQNHISPPSSQAASVIGSESDGPPSQSDQVGMGAMLLEGFGAEDPGLGRGGRGHAKRPSQASNPTGEIIQGGGIFEGKVDQASEESGTPGTKALDGESEDGEGKEGRKEAGGKRESQLSITSPGGAPSSLGRRPSIKEPPALLRRSVRRVLPIRSAVSLRVTSTWTSLLENTILLSIDLANEKDAGHSYILYGVEVEIANSAVRYLGDRIDEDEVRRMGRGEGSGGKGEMKEGSHDLLYPTGSRKR